jgi:hypothetical protein
VKGQPTKEEKSLPAIHSIGELIPRIYKEFKKNQTPKEPMIHSINGQMN